jgi:hypothetical protein
MTTNRSCPENFIAKLFILPGWKSVYELIQISTVCKSKSHLTYIEAMKTFSLIFALAALIWSCSNANLFSTNDDEKAERTLDGPSGQTVVEMRITGGFAGVNQQLLIDANRYVQFIDQRGQRGQVETVLTTEEMNRLITVFIEQDFVHLKSQYIDANVADAFFYRIIYRYNGADKEVETDYFGAPAELRIIVDHLLNLIKPLHGLALEFKTSAEQLRHGEKLTLTLTATNRNTTPLTIHTGGQKYDFFATSAATAESRAAAQTARWNWAYDKVFIAIVITETLQPGESRTYSAEWDGRSNQGELLEGEFLLGARLVSQPGGFSALQKVVVTK